MTEVLDKYLNKGLISKEHKARLLWFLQYLQTSYSLFGH